MAAADARPRVTRTPRVLVWLTLASVLALGALLTLAGGSAAEVDLLEVTAVEPTRWEAGQRVSIEGNGFPVGRTATLHLTGRSHRADGEVVPVDVFVEGRAVHERRVELRADGPALDALGGRATFRGELEVSFASEGRHPVRGRLADVVVDWIPPERAEGAGSLPGVSLADDDEGIVVESVTTEATEAGLSVGQRIHDVNGFRPTRSSELGVATATSPLDVVVSEGAEVRHVALTVGDGDAPTLLARRRMGLAVALVVFALLFGAAFEQRARARLDNRAEPSAIAPLRRAFATVVVVAIAVAIALRVELLVAIEPLVWLGIAAKLGATTARVRRGASDRRELVEAIVAALAIALASLSAVLAAGSSLVDALTELQRPRIGLLGHPGGLVAILALAAASVLGTPASSPSTPSLLDRLDSVASATLGWLVVIGFLGGADPHAPLLRWVGTTCVATAVGGLLSMGRDVGLSRALLACVAAAGSAASVAIVWASLELSLSSIDKQVLAEVSVLVLALVALRVTSRRRTPNATRSLVFL